MDVQFHCDQQGNFRLPHQLVRGFSYKDYSIEPHTHEFYEMNIILRGSGTHCLQDRKLSVRPGDVFVIPPTVVHAYRETKALEVYHILLHKDFLRSQYEQSARVPGYLHLMEIEPFLRSNDSSLFLHLSGSQLMQLQAELQFLDEASAFDQPLKDHATWKLIYWFSWLLSRQMEKSRQEHKYAGSILIALEHIHGHLGEKLTIDSLCHLTYLSRSTFLRSFQEICGCTPTAYIRNCRSKKAMELLEQETFSKTEVAHACGFYDLSHMERSMKKDG